MDSNWLLIVVAIAVLSFILQRVASLYLWKRPVKHWLHVLVEFWGLISQIVLVIVAAILAAPLLLSVFSVVIAVIISILGVIVAVVTAVVGVLLSVVMIIIAVVVQLATVAVMLSPFIALFWLVSVVAGRR